MVLPIDIVNVDFGEAIYTWFFFWKKKKKEETEIPLHVITESWNIRHWKGPWKHDVPFQLFYVARILSLSTKSMKL